VKKTFQSCLLVMILQLCIFNIAAMEKTVIGWIEPVKLDKGKIQLLAKIDTGADSSSLHADDIKEFTRQGKDWVRFSIHNAKGKTHEIEAEVIKYIKIKRKEMHSHRRPVIKMYICLAKKEREVLVNLTDRSNYKYPMLIGRSFLVGAFLVDSENKDLTRPDC
jgi:hypothetical protein